MVTLILYTVARFDGLPIGHAQNARKGCVVAITPTHTLTSSREYALRRVLFIFDGGS
jgi:hypothetical protein